MSCVLTPDHICFSSQTLYIISAAVLVLISAAEILSDMITFALDHSHVKYIRRHTRRSCSIPRYCSMPRSAVQGKMCRRITCGLSHTSR